MDGRPSGEVTFLFTGIEGSSQLCREEGLAHSWPGEEAELARATRIIADARSSTLALMAARCIAPFPTV